MRSALLITGSKWLVAFILRPRLEDLKRRYLDRSSPLDERLQPNTELSKQAPRLDTRNVLLVDERHNVRVRPFKAGKII